MPSLTRACTALPPCSTVAAHDVRASDVQQVRESRIEKKTVFTGQQSGFFGGKKKTKKKDEAKEEEEEEEEELAGGAGKAAAGGSSWQD